MTGKIVRYLKIIAEQKHKFRFIASRILMKSGVSKHIIFKRGAYKLRFHPSSLTASLWVNGKERLGEEAFVASLVKQNDFVIDVGANIGTVALALAGKADVYAFEPHPKIFEFLVDNIALNGFDDRIKPFCLALGEREETLYFSDQSDDTNNAVSEKGAIKIHVKRLDDALEDCGPVRLLKIDVEGFEYQVLLGGVETCRAADMIYLECIPAMLEPHGGSEEKICVFLEKLGFTVYQVLGDALTPNVIGSHKKKMLLAKRG